MRQKVLILCFVLCSRHSTGLRIHSSCSKSSNWTRNSGDEIKSWLFSIVPSSNSVSHRCSLEFTSGKDFDKLRMIYSLPSKIKWKAIGDYKLDGWFYGQTDGSGNFMKDRTYFLYPDFRTALIGTFEDQRLIHGVETKASHFRCRNGILELKLSPPKNDSPIYKHIERSRHTLSHNPILRDPLEKRNVYVGSGRLIPETSHQDSLFAKRNIPPFNLISYYGGNWEDLSTPHYQSNMTIDEMEERYQYLLTFNKTHLIDIPPDMSDIRKYRSTLGHKANHHFLGANAAFEYTTHPVYGSIRCLESLKQIEQGEEIIVNYRYDMDSPGIPRWYENLYKKIYPNGEDSQRL
ncbi:SETD7 [Lepeophtheirus salmonis]|uniref:SET domain containing (Lysine methyltransferase) 7 [Camelus ferus] n=1 Tax=Lepeophtheirus salmonis TaxID=72036 RepID=A0A0K2VHR7_LEPSM|nr:SETD7 [Lepeophtheirus salmonis]CAF2803602.1 SETD7 [Lepeophtheirus salmonis]